MFFEFYNCKMQKENEGLSASRAEMQIRSILRDVLKGGLLRMTGEAAGAVAVSEKGFKNLSRAGGL